jgi:hypothetical protein
MFGAEQVNRPDIAIEVLDGTKFYRRVTGSSASGDEETLQLDSALGQAVAPGAVRSIGWLSVCASATDNFQIEHQDDADGRGVANINWQALKNDI